MYKHQLVLVLLVVIAVSPARADSVQDACKALVLDYAFYRDRPDADALASLFTDDGTLSVLGNEFTGRDEIRARIAGAPELVFRHMMSTIRIFPEEDDHASGVSYVTIYSAPVSDGRPLVVEGITAVGEYHDQFVRTLAGWKIKRREFVFVFSPPADD